MNEVLDLIKLFLPGKSEKTYKSIGALIGVTNKVLVEERSEESENEVTPADIVKSLKRLGYDVELPGQETDKSQKNKATPFSYSKNGTIEDDEPEISPHESAMKAFNINRLSNDKDAARKTILKDVIGSNHQTLVYEQNVAFGKYLRNGDRDLDRKEMKLLGTQLFSEEAIMTAVLDQGFDVATIKATQVEAQGDLGGIAVPPNRQAEFTRRLPGLTSVRGSGARVITLVNSNSVEIPHWFGDDVVKQRYVGTIRGQWGNETKQPDAQNFKIKMLSVNAEVYTYKVPLSQSVVEDAANLVTMLMEDINITLAMDEDMAFLVGDGIGKPEGILPNRLNKYAYKEVTTGVADELTPRGIKALKRAVASQYRQSCIWVATSGTYGVIESMRDDSGANPDTGRFLFEDLSDKDTLLSRKIYENEEMAEIEADAYPLLFGNMAGYDIVERLGMTIQRFQDSNTGPNVVEYHVRKRIGGKVERPWMFAVQKVAEGDPFS